MSQCARTGDKRKGKQRGRAGAGQRVKGERGQRKQRSGTAEHRRGQRHAQPTQEMLILATTCHPIGASLLTVQNLMKYCRTVAAMNKQYTSE